MEHNMTRLHLICTIGIRTAGAICNIHPVTSYKQPTAFTARLTHETHLAAIPSQLGDTTRTLTPFLAGPSSCMQ